MSFHFFSSGFDKKEHQYLTSKISHCGSKCETLSCLCTYPVVVVAGEKEPKKRKKKYAPMQEDTGMFCVVHCILRSLPFSNRKCFFIHLQFQKIFSNLWLFVRNYLILFYCLLIQLRGLGICLLSSTSWIIWTQCALDGTPATAGPGATGLKVR